MIPDKRCWTETLLMLQTAASYSLRAYKPLCKPLLHGNGLSVCHAFTILDVLLLRLIARKLCAFFHSLSGTFVKWWHYLGGAGWVSDFMGIGLFSPWSRPGSGVLRSFESWETNNSMLVPLRFLAPLFVSALPLGTFFSVV